MKKIVLIISLTMSLLHSEVIKVVPFAGAISYSDDSEKSIKESSSLVGLYTNSGTLDYLLEFSYSHLDTTYRSDENLSNLQQHDISLIYGKYFQDYMFRVGVHYTQTNDTILGNGIIAVLGIGSYKNIVYDRLTYGVEGYFSIYENRINENSSRSSSNLLGIFQLTPYFTYFKSISTTMSNQISLKGNFQVADSYAQKEYLSYELRDTFYYKSLFLELYFYGGEMKSGVKDTGLSVYNSLDLIKSGYSAKVGYYINTDLITTFSYGVNSYKEYRITHYGNKAENSVAVATLSYRF